MIVGRGGSSGKNGSFINLRAGGSILSYTCRRVLEQNIEPKLVPEVARALYGMRVLLTAVTGSDQTGRDQGRITGRLVVLGSHWCESEAGWS